MYRFWHKVGAVGCLGWLTMVGVMPGCGSGLGPVTVTQMGGIDRPNFPDVFVEHAKECVSEHGKLLEPGRHRFDSTVDVDDEGVKWGVTIDGIPDTAADLGACLRIALANMPIADEPFRRGVETLNFRREEALAEQRKLVGHPIVLVIAGVTIVVSEVALEAGAVTILLAVSVTVIDKASKDVAEMAKRGARGRSSCVTGYVNCIMNGGSPFLGNNWNITRCATCQSVCENRTPKSWPSSVEISGVGTVSCY